MEKNNKLSTVESISLQIKKELTNESVSRALLATTFKGLNEVSMRQALMEGLVLGFTFEDFLKKDVYAIPYGTGYSLITSIDHSRKLAMRSGQTGKDAPVFTYKPDGKVDSCTVTVHKKIDGVVGDFTATVYFDEYTTGKNQWASKPRTMIAKVAEMHALRMAFPEELAKTYVQEEMEMPKATVVDTPVGISDTERNNAINSLEETKLKADLLEVWASLTAKQRGDAGVKATYERLAERVDPAPTPAKTKKVVNVDAGEVDPAIVPDIQA